MKPEYRKFCDFAVAAGVFSFDAEHDPARPPSSPGFVLAGMSFATVVNSEIHAMYVTDLADVRDIVLDLFPRQTEAIAFNAKYDLKCLNAGIGLDPSQYPVNLCDPMVVLNLLDENVRPNELGLKATVLRRYGHQMMTFEQAIAFGLGSPQFAKYSCDDAVWELRLWRDIFP